MTVHLPDSARPDPRAPDLVTRTDLVLRPDPSRVLARLFIPGHELLLSRESRTSGVLTRILALPEEQVVLTLRDVLARYERRHRDFAGVLRAHFQQIAHRVPDVEPLTEDRQCLLGAWFTNEFAVEGAALFNPSAVPHPDQSGLPPGSLRFVLSLRAVGEGHLSTVEFRTGVLGPGGTLQLDDPGRHVEGGVVGPTYYDRGLFAAELSEHGADSESATFLLDELDARFSRDELDAALSALGRQRLTRPGAALTVELARRLAQSSYSTEFSPQSTVSERVLWPATPTESQGIEDVRFVRFRSEDGGTGDGGTGDGRPSYRGTYTAFDGARITPQLIETDDFRRFRMSALAGPSAVNKGMALFPRTVGGRYLALSRWDRENISLADSADGLVWGEPTTIHRPTQPWELIQTGNCGSPLETEAGWLVLTHGVGPIREYSIGALLLDLQDPRRVLGALREPLLRPDEQEREGYVPNVVYSCGALLHGTQLLLAYGASDASVRFAFVDVPRLLERLAADGPPARRPDVATTSVNSAA